MKKRRERDHARQTVSERQTTSQWKVPVNAELRPLKEREKRGTKFSDTHFEGGDEDVMERSSISTQDRHIYYSFIHTCLFLAQERLDPMILKDLEHHATRKLLI